MSIATKHGNDTEQFVSKFIGDEVTKNLVINFFVVFSRFEYAMKRSGYLKNDSKKKDRRAEPDWDKLANKINPKFSLTSSSEFNAAVLYLKTHPPKKQMVVDDNLSWLDLAKGSDKSNCRWIIRTVKTVRNNLFHGGKFPEPIGPIAGTERDKELLESSIIVLFHISSLDANLNRFFFEEP